MMDGDDGHGTERNPNPKAHEQASAARVKKRYVHLPPRAPAAPFSRFFFKPNCQAGKGFHMRTYIHTYTRARAHTDRWMEAFHFRNHDNCRNRSLTNCTFLIDRTPDESIPQSLRARASAAIAIDLFFALLRFWFGNFSSAVCALCNIFKIHNYAISFPPHSRAVADFPTPSGEPLWITF